MNEDQCFMLDWIIVIQSWKSETNTALLATYGTFKYVDILYYLA